MDVLKIATAGSVDDGKSTLIGRLLYETNSLSSDKLEAIQSKSEQLGYDYTDFSLATDGLIAEREQGITIDVAHIYFSTARRSYIIADTPGHIEYTRNMVTGASTSQASIILVDARKGVVEQTYRHFFINNLLRVNHLIVAINKMDLVDYSEDQFKAIKSDFEELIERSGTEQHNISFIPVSALKGDNITERSALMPWYQGKSILEHVENLNPSESSVTAAARFPIQNVIRPKTAEFHDFRAYAGKLYGGELSVGDEIMVLPSQTSSVVKDIYIYDQLYKTVLPNTSVSITLTDDVNLSRGDMIVKASELPISSKQCFAVIAWMDQSPLQAGNMYTIQHGSQKVLGKISDLVHQIQPDYSGVDDTKMTLQLNDIGLVNIKFNKAIHYDPFKKDRNNGSFIIIDNKTNNTAGVGFIQ